MSRSESMRQYWYQKTGRDATGKKRATLLVGARHGAPCGAVLVPAGQTYRLGDGDGSVLFQGDTDLQHLARNLGAPSGCDCCPEDGNPGGEGAWDWLNDHDGETFDDPGYLGEGA